MRWPPRGGARPPGPAPRRSWPGPVAAGPAAQGRPWGKDRSFVRSGPRQQVAEAVLDGHRATRSASWTAWAMPACPPRRAPPWSAGRESPCCAPARGCPGADLRPVPAPGCAGERSPGPLPSAGPVPAAGTAHSPRAVPGPRRSGSRSARGGWTESRPTTSRAAYRRHSVTGPPSAASTTKACRAAAGLPAWDPDVLPLAVEEDALRRARPQGSARPRSRRSAGCCPGLSCWVSSIAAERQYAPQPRELFADGAAAIRDASGSLPAPGHGETGQDRGGKRRPRHTISPRDGTMILTPVRVGDPVRPAGSAWAGHPARPGNYLVC